MNKNKIIMSALGGIAGLATLVIGYLVFSSWSDQSLMQEDLDAAQSSVQRLRSAKIPPVEASVKAIDANREKLAAWLNEAQALASQGDFDVKSGVTAAAFKQEMVDDARDLAKLPGAVNGVLVAEGFGFGFNDIITGGSMPDATKLARLNRQWTEIKLFVKTLADCGVAELTGVTVATAPAVEPEEEKRPSRSARRGKKVEKKKEVRAPDAQAYELKFRAKPAAFVRVLNALGSASRFITVDDFALVRAEDTLATQLGGGKEKTAAASTSRRGRRGRRAAAVEAPEGEQAEETVKKGLVTDPASDAPLMITVNLTTFDFGSKLPKPAEATDAKEDNE